MRKAVEFINQVKVSTPLNPLSLGVSLGRSLPELHLDSQESRDEYHHDGSDESADQADAYPIHSTLSSILDLYTSSGALKSWWYLTVGADIGATIQK
jgi:hypothetical protein